MNFFKNYLSTMLFILVAYFGYNTSSHYTEFLSHSLKVSFWGVETSTNLIFLTIVGIYTLSLIPFYLYYPQKSKARIVLTYFWKVIKGGDNSLSQIEKTALLAWIVKIFFAPLMIMWLSDHVFGLVNNIYNFWLGKELVTSNFVLFYKTYLFWTAFSLILFIDVFFFTIGYLIEMPALKNTIRSVEPTIIGWGVALICYPPFNSSLTGIIGWYSSDFPQFENDFAQIFFPTLILIVMGIYSWASLALGFKASNLTNRGIVSHGPYKYIRHPAYICKNIAWWIGGIPFLVAALSNNDGMALILGLIGLSGWTFVYYLRAITEENHLSSDDEYIVYKKQVPWKFIPKVW